MPDLLGPYLKGKRVLVVEDDSALRGVIAKVMESDGAEVRSAENGLVAKNILDLDLGRFDLILSDVRMPEMDGISLLAYAKSTFPKITFFIFTGFSEILEAKKAHELGADGFLPKPFRLIELRKSIYTAMLPGAETQRDGSIFCKIQVDHFLTIAKFPSDLFMQVAPEKFVKIEQEGAVVQIPRLQTFKEKNIQYLYVSAEDFHKYNGINLKGIKADTLPPVSRKEKLEMLEAAKEVLDSKIFGEGFPALAKEDSEVLLFNAIAMVSENPELFRALKSHGDKNFSVALSVGAYASLLAAQMGWTSAQSQYKLAIAGIFHNIGLRGVPEILHGKPLLQMVPTELKLYQSHPLMGRDYLSTVSGFPEDLALAISQHHENPKGTGYPLGVSSHKIHPLANVLRVADEFVARVNEGKMKEFYEFQELAKEIYLEKASEFDSEVLGALFSVVQLEKPAELVRKHVA